jgi:hypothetical protein
MIGANTGANTKNSPSPGSISICFYCGQVGLFEEDLTVRKMSDEEMEAIKVKEPQIYNIILMTVEAIRKKLKEK